MKQGWENKILGDVLDVLRNGVNCKQDKKGVGDKISSIESISNADFDIDKVGFATLSKSDKEKYRLAKGDILFSHINSPIHVGKTALFNSDEEVYHGVNLLLMRPKPFLDGNYFEHFLKFIFQNGYWKGLCKQSVNQASVNQQDINKVEISFPKSLPEQQRIVAILDEAFAAIAKAKANAEQNLKNAKELFESYLQGVFEKKGNDWEEKKLGDVCIVERGSSPRPIENFVTNSIDGVNWIKIGDTKKVDKYIYSTKEKITKEGAEKSRYVKDGDFILSNSMSFGKPYIMKTDGYIHDGWFVFRLPTYIDNDFFYYLLISPIVQKQIQSLGAGAIVKNISGDLVKRVDLFYPKSINAQKELVRQLDNLRLETKKLEKVFSNKIIDLNELKKSILQKAFAGELSL